MNPLTPEELQAAKEAHERRTLSLRSRGWLRADPFTRRDVAQWAFERWDLRNNARRVQ